MDSPREWLILIVDALIPRRYERPFLLGLLFLVGATCLGLGGWFLSRSLGEDGEALWVPTALFGGAGLLFAAFAIRAARRAP